MKVESIWALTIAATFALAAVQPTVEPIDVKASQLVASLAQSCDNTACMAGWTAAKQAELNDVDECPRVAIGQAELAGCKAFVQWARDEGEMQALVERGL